MRFCRLVRLLCAAMVFGMFSGNGLASETPPLAEAIDPVSVESKGLAARSVLKPRMPNTKPAGPQGTALKSISAYKKFSEDLRQTMERVTTSRTTAPLSGVSPGGNRSVQRFVNQRQIRRTGDVQSYFYLDDISDLSIDQLRNNGVRIDLVNEELRVVQGWTNVERLKEIDALDNVIKVTSPSYGVKRVGAFNTQGDAILRANLLRRLNLSGEGVKIGIISDGANDWTIARDIGELPASGISTYGSCIKEPEVIATCTPASNCNEGTAMAEIIHDIAPGADLAVGAAGTSLEFIERVGDLVNIFGADIIVDDLGFFNEPFFEDGPVAQAVAAIDDDVVFVSAAGNSAERHHESFYLDFLPLDDNDNTHNFGFRAGQPSSWNFPIFAEPNGLAFVFLQWADAFGLSDNDYDLAVDIYNADTIEYIDTLASAGDQTGTQNPEESTGFCNPFPFPVFGLFYVNKLEAESKRLEVFAITNARSEVLDNVVETGSVFGHPAVTDVVAVGAINAQDAGHNSKTPYSAYGNSRIEVGNVESRSKPDVMAIDGVSVSGTGGFPSQFFGTSAAAPHVAGIAALMKQTMPHATVPELRDAILQGAVDIGSFGRDLLTGEGRVDALGAESLLDTDDDGLINLVDPDDDNDNFLDIDEAIARSSRLDPDSDDDMILDPLDNCPVNVNFDQVDENMNGIGDVCEVDDICFPVKASNGSVGVICL